MNFPEERYERVKNIIIYFLQHTEKVNFLKLCLLFYFLDKECYIQTAFSMTEFTYIAKEQGPIPCDKDLEYIIRILKEVVQNPPKLLSE